MKTIGIDELKRRLSSILKNVERNEKFLVTRHNREVALLTAAPGEGVHHGARFGKGNLEPVLRHGSRGVYLEELQADRTRESNN